MMEALGQLAKDGTLLAPTHKHIGLIKSHLVKIVAHIVVP